MKKRIALLLTVLLTLSAVSRVSGAEGDQYALNDEVKNTYSGRMEATDMIYNLSFVDVPEEHWASESIIRGGALNFVKGYSQNYYPEGFVTNEEALAFIIRTIGMEQQALALAAALVSQSPPDTYLSQIWSLGYLLLAQNLTLITAENFTDAINTDQTLVPFARNAPASREQVAQWLYYALSSVMPGMFEKPDTTQAILTYNDWELISADKAEAVDVLTSNGVLGGTTGGYFNPKGYLSRAEMAQILKNLDSVYMPLFNMEKKNGTVVSINDSQMVTNGAANLWRNILVRTGAGEIDSFIYEISADSDDMVKDRDAVVYRNGVVTGLASLREGDTVSYIVDINSNNVLYVYAYANVVVSEARGILNQVNAADKIVTLTDGTGKLYSYQTTDALIQTRDGVVTLHMDGKDQAVADLPFGSNVVATLANNVMTEISYVGEPHAITELKAIVIENDVDFGTLTVLDDSGNLLVKRYYESEMKVSKVQYYDTGLGELGYIAEIFPHFNFDKNETVISDVEPGDIVTMRFAEDDGDVITNISASTNYSMRYGKIKEFSDNGDYVEMLVEFENKQTAWFDFSNQIFITKSGRPTNVTGVIVGDWVKLLVNEAVISAGYVMETVKEMTVEGEGHHISTIVKGNLSGIDAIQKQLIIENSQELLGNSWANYSNLSKYSLAGKDIEYYNGNQQISLDYAVKYFKRSDAVVYVALENNYAGEKVKKVTFRIDRDELLTPDTVLQASGAGDFGVISVSGDISTDAGTIVRRHGRLVDGKDILASDYVKIALNGENKAAVVDITDAPSVDDIVVARGRILSVNEGRSFKVQSMSVLSGMKWIYTPIQREFSIDYNTRFITAEGTATIDSFIGYTEDTVLDKVYNIVIDGSRAAYIIDAPYTINAVRGTIYETADGALSIKDAAWYDNATGKWTIVNNTNNTLSIALAGNTIIGKSNQIIPPSGLAAGDQIKVFTDINTNNVSSGTEINGYIVLVEK